MSNPIRLKSHHGRGIVAASILGSSIAFLDGTVVNVALPTIGRELGGGLSGLQWVVDAYLVTLGALLLLGGAIGDRFGQRRTFLLGLGGFTAASLLCALAPSMKTLATFRAVQ